MILSGPNEQDDSYQRKLGLSCAKLRTKLSYTKKAGA